MYRPLLAMLPLLLLLSHVTIIQKGFAKRKLVIRSRCAKKSERHRCSIAAENGLRWVHGRRGAKGRLAEGADDENGTHISQYSNFALAFKTRISYINTKTLHPLLHVSYLNNFFDYIFYHRRSFTAIKEGKQKKE